MSTTVGNTKMQEFIGYAAADKAQDSRELLVYPAELLPFLSGEISAKEVENQIRTKGTNEYSGTVKTSTIIKCLYRDETSNRAFPPDIRKGEEVVIYNYGDDNTYYWKSSGRNDNARRTETYRVAISGTLKNVAENNDDSTYFFEMDTRRSHRIRISTSNQDGEQFRYTFCINADKNEVFLGDNNGNQFYIKSDQPRVCMKNTDGSLVDLNMTNIVIAAKKDISITSTEGNITFTAQKGKMTSYAKSDMSLETEANFSRKVKVDSTTNIDGNETCTTKGNKTCTTQGNEDYTVQGNYTQSVQGNYTQSVKGNHNTSIQGNYQLQAKGTGNIASTGNMTVASQAQTTISSSASLTLAAGGGLNMSFTGSGTMTGNGGTLTMNLAHLSINQG